MRRKLLIIVLIILIALFFMVQGSSYNAFKITGYKALKTITYYNNTKVNKDWDLHETNHFIINSKDIDSNTIESLGILFEKSYYLIGEEFDYYPNKKTPIIVYNTMSDFWDHIKPLAGQDVMGLYYMGVIHIISPNAFDMDLNEYEKNGAVLHEYTHKVVDDITGGNIDLWFTEGLALYQEYINYDVEWGEGLVFDKEYTMEELRDSFLSLEPVQAYKQSFEKVKNIYEADKDRLIKLLTELGKGKEVEDAFLFIYGENLFCQ
ncbi:MAG: hypothetical protein M0P77_06450 [Firmicutes bacterium]|nr:hypothetical protein [Bacillota bacterium]